MWTADFLLLAHPGLAEVSAFRSAIEGEADLVVLDLSKAAFDVVDGTHSAASKVP